MEKKKLLLVAVSVGIFLVIVISASILIFTPNTGTYAAAVSPVQYGTSGSSISPQEVSPPPRITPAEAEDVRESQPSLQEDTYNSENGDTSSRITINVPKPSTAAVPDNPTGTSNRAETTRGSTSAPAGARSTPSANATAAKPAARPAATANSGSTSRNILNDYWVQTGAFSTKIRAEGVKEVLAEKGITSIIENRNADGRTLYRVRVGPYTSENEANYWLALIKSIDGFADSQVRQTNTLR